MYIFIQVLLLYATILKVKGFPQDQNSFGGYTDENTSTNADLFGSGGIERRFQEGMPGGGSLGSGQEGDSIEVRWNGGGGGGGPPGGGGGGPPGGGGGGPPGGGGGGPPGGGGGGPPGGGGGGPPKGGGGSPPGGGGGGPPGGGGGGPPSGGGGGPPGGGGGGPPGGGQGGKPGGGPKVVPALPVLTPYQQTKMFLEHLGTRASVLYMPYTMRLHNFIHAAHIRYVNPFSLQKYHLPVTVAQGNMVPGFPIPNVQTLKPEHITDQQILAGALNNAATWVMGNAQRWYHGKKLMNGPPKGPGGPPRGPGGPPGGGPPRGGPPGGGGNGPQKRNLDIDEYQDIQARSYDPNQDFGQNYGELPQTRSNNYDQGQVAAYDQQPYNRQLGDAENLDYGGHGENQNGGYQEYQPQSRFDQNYEQDQITNRFLGQDNQFQGQDENSEQENIDPNQPHTRLSFTNEDLGGGGYNSQMQEPSQYDQQ